MANRRADIQPHIPWKQWGTDLEPTALDQMRRACSLPISLAAALMPDAHPGFGLPIGGVLATDNAVIPYAVGVDIACRVRITVSDLPPSILINDPRRLRDAIHKETRFGIGAEFEKPRDHDVLDMDWSITPLVSSLKRRAQSQLGTSGSGNHFVEFGELEVSAPTLGLQPAVYLALLSHSGSRGPGAAIASHYSKLAKELHPELPRELQELAWFSLDSAEGQEYWAAMSLMGHYASANHALIHQHIHQRLGSQVLASIENHHNFAWKETHSINGQSREVIVHRKGATPASAGTLGVIPGSMASPTFIVEGLAQPDSLHSASHGAGRVMSRTQAKKNLNWADVNQRLSDNAVTLISAGLDEAPHVYKDIHSVMAAQADLVKPLATFHPRLVKMAPPGERAED
ncbi:MAG: RtcB family protein [Phycisphaerales bacterium]